MAKKIYFGVGGKAKDGKNAYIGIGGKARKIKNAYIGVNGVARQFWSSGITATISVDTAPGTSIKDYAYAKYNNVDHYTGGETFEVNAGDTIQLYVKAYNFSTPGRVYINNTSVYSNASTTLKAYSWTVPSARSISISLENTDWGSMHGVIRVTTT